MWAATASEASAEQIARRSEWIERLREGEDLAKIITEQHIPGERQQESLRVRSMRNRLLRESVPPETLETLAPLVEVRLRSKHRRVVRVGLPADQG